MTRALLFIILLAFSSTIPALSQSLTSGQDVPTDILYEFKSLLLRVDGHKMTGSWNKITPESDLPRQAPVLSHKNGLVSSNFTYSPETDVFKFTLKLFNSHYEDSPYLFFQDIATPILSGDEDLQSYLLPNQTFISPPREMGFQEVNKYFIPTEISTIVKITFILNNDALEEEEDQDFIFKGSDVKTLGFKIDIYSKEGSCDFDHLGDECLTDQFEGVIKIEFESFIELACLYVFILAIALIKVKYTVQIIRSISNSQVDSNKFSYQTTGLILIFDLSVVLTYLKPSLDIYALTYRVAGSIVVWIGILCSDLTQLEIIAKSEDSILGSRCKNLLQTLISGGLLICASFLFTISDGMKLSLSLALLPQIWQNMKQDDLIAYQKSRHIIGSSITFLLLGYYKGTDRNLLHVSPNMKLCIMFFSIHFFLCIVLCLQTKLGPRFFLPKFLQKKLPNKYFHFSQMQTDLEANDEAEIDQCAICLNQLDQQPEAQSSSSAQMIIRNLGSKKGALMKTPCNHVFHTPCLVEWISRKDECPVCRANIEKNLGKQEIEIKEV